jgi:hypothetical protein
MQKVQKKTELKKSELKTLYFCEVLDLENLAWETGYYQRQAKKITATALFLSFFQMHQNGKNTLRNWCLKLSNLIGQTIKKQSLDGRFKTTTTALAKASLKRVLNHQIDQEKLNQNKAFLKNIPNFFNRILIRDSTTQKLPNGLSSLFKGSFSHGIATAIFRVQALMNFTAECWEDIQLGAYTDNDQGAADCIKGVLKRGDLLLQDMGYFTLSWLSQVIVDQFIITKWKSNTSLFDTDGTKINLLEELKKKKQLDQDVLVGSEHKIIMRLVARKLPAAKAKKRIRAAKKERHSKTNHSKEYYELLRYEIYLTNIPRSVLNCKEVAKLYGLRWHIEILFKSWKSYGKFKAVFDVPKMKVQRVLFTIYAVLLEMVFLQNCIFTIMHQHIDLKTDKQLSCLKFMDIVNDLAEQLFLIKSIEHLKEFVPLFFEYGTYDKRPKRKNTKLKYLYVKEL